MLRQRLWALRGESLTRTRNAVSRVYKALHPPSEVADLELQKAGCVDAPATDRLRMLRKVSRTHGVSWEELDTIFFQFLDAKETRNSRWQREKDANLDKADKMDADRLEKMGLRRKRRLTRLTNWSRKNLEYFKPEDLGALLDDVLTKRLVQRETFERTFDRTSERTSSRTSAPSL